MGKSNFVRNIMAKKMKTKINLHVLICGFLMLAMPSVLFAEPSRDGKCDALKNTVILVIRHAEKPASGLSLSPEGEARAAAYVNYFKQYRVEAKPLKLEAIFATADSKGSQRPRLTVEPTAKALGLTIDTQFKDKAPQALADEICSRPHGKAILIAWHHGQIPALLGALGADPKQVIPNAKWPDNVFGWVIQLRYDADGRLVEAKRINENLMPGDSGKPAGK